MKIHCAVGARAGLVVVACALAALIAAPPAHASFHTFAISELYSDAAGSVQFVELHEIANVNGQNFLGGHALTSQQGATTRVYTFPNDLPSSATAGKSVLIGTPAFAALGVVSPDYVVPAPFLFPGGGTLNYADVDVISYPALPTDGVHSVDHGGVVGVNSPTNFAGQTGSIGAPPPPPPPPPVTDTFARIPTLTDAGLAGLIVALVAAAAIVLRRRRDQT